jgi:hypothetical protein
VAFVKLSLNICDLFVNVNKNDSYYTLFPKERKVFEKITGMGLGINYDELDPAVERTVSGMRGDARRRGNGAIAQARGCLIALPIK